MLLKSAGKTRVSRVDKKQRIRNPSAPFTTSTLQQQAVRKLGFTTKRTMIVAQKLYEGIDTGNETVGLISYMRTDSMTLSNDVIQQIRDYIKSHYDSRVSFHKLPLVIRQKQKMLRRLMKRLGPQI